ncbi:hypothetical protein A2U01_0054334, partial [Trifolium medium]|nr:hypothetical protein [Trifolium medium]
MKCHGLQIWPISKSEEYTWKQKKKFFNDAKYYVWDDPYMFKEGRDGLLR